MMITILAGGTGAARFIRGLTSIVPPECLAIVVNTGDDLEWWGLHVSPDIDTILYCLAGLLDRRRGWGVETDQFACHDQMKRFGEPTWFNLGDRDLALHLHRSRLLRDGHCLSKVTRRIADSLGVTAQVLPMSDHPVRTWVRTTRGPLAFQEFFVRERFEPDVVGVDYRHAESARPGPGVIDAIRSAEAVLVAPSNPITSVGPILAVPGIAEALAETPAPVAAVSPIVAGSAVSGPAGKLMKAAGYDVTPLGVAQVYRPFLNVLVADRRDSEHEQRLRAMGVSPVFTDTLMGDEPAERRLARHVLDAAIGGPPDVEAE